jgi:hypothetical protein
MRRSVVRIVLLAVALMIVAAPGPAQYEEGSCKDCRHWCDFDGYCFQYCGQPANNSWGKETCSIEMWGNIQVCRTRGNGCYYFEVQG